MKDNKKLKNNKSPEEKPMYLPIYMSIGLSVGMAIGAAVGQIPIGMCIGMAIGVGIGALLDAQARKESNTSPTDEQVTDEIEENNENGKAEWVLRFLFAYCISPSFSKKLLPFYEFCDTIKQSKNL